MNKQSDWKEPLDTLDNAIQEILSENARLRSLLNKCAMQCGVCGEWRPIKDEMTRPGEDGTAVFSNVCNHCVAKAE